MKRKKKAGKSRKKIKKSKQTMSIRDVFSWLNREAEDRWEVWEIRKLYP